ncbi:MAG: gas vesicle structural protein GvpA [Okeania sp. SIO2D1]|uniref:gas vesicle structural protein GvpA n=1 Tax=Okeania sp. SIO2C9 TaxID=2607791 RepID=UPI0013BAC6E0|nr:gas vesicle structural protein GvpA [Okeania sp. SIO2C9]NEQ75544.1 gas vesicle structural protein GvpA [Okeania sp. SIO2C9]NES71440.1 gas vesicle structural protein GvpA [Okeania sp. SIO2D1]
MAVEKVNSSSSLAEVVDRILDKGVVIDAWVRVSLVGIELLAVEARIVIASVETYLKYAEAVGLTALAAAPAVGTTDETEIGQPMASPTLV